jgi:hypothetical protein
MNIEHAFLVAQWNYMELLELKKKLAKKNQSLSGYKLDSTLNPTGLEQIFGIFQVFFSRILKNL